MFATTSGWLLGRTSLSAVCSLVSTSLCAAAGIDVPLPVTATNMNSCIWLYLQLTNLICQAPCIYTHTLQILWGLPYCLSLFGPSCFWTTLFHCVLALSFICASCIHVLFSAPSPFQLMQNGLNYCYCKGNTFQNTWPI